jgi:hypothetical protein
MGDLFKNVYELQKQQLMNVADPGSSNFNDIQTTLNRINNGSINNPILDSENERLNKKNEQIQSFSESQDRMNALNESYRKRNWEYVKLLIVVAISLLTILGISMFLRNIIPDSFIDLINAIIIGVIIIYAYITHRTVSARTAIDFDKLNLSNPSSNTSDEANKEVNKKIISAGESGDILGAAGVGISNACSGASCCEAGTKWCASKNRCIASSSTCPETFATMGPRKEKDYYETEYENYSPYN